MIRGAGSCPGHVKNGIVQHDGGSDDDDDDIVGLGSYRTDVVIFEHSNFISQLVNLKYRPT